MGRRSKSLTPIVLVSGSLLISGAVYGQPHGTAVRHAPALNTMRERWYSLSPDERQVFRRNAERWLKMGPEERNLMRERERVRRARLQQEAEAALREAGLRLDQQKRELFEQRYVQERRKIERELLLETEAKRKQKLPALNARLRHEFEETSPSGAASSSSSPTSSLGPKH